MSSVIVMSIQIVIGNVSHVILNAKHAQVVMILIVLLAHHKMSTFKKVITIYVVFVKLQMVIMYLIKFVKNVPLIAKNVVVQKKKIVESV